MKSHDSLGEAEKCHAYLRSLFERVLVEHQNVPNKLVLQLAVKACNDKAGPDGLAPVLLDFGIASKMPIHHIGLPKQRVCLKALHDARKQMSRVMAQSHLNRAADSRGPGAADANFKIGDLVLVY